VLGSATDPSQWKLPLDDGELGEIKFHNWRRHKIIDKFGLFINLCVSDEAIKQDWLRILGKFNLVNEDFHQKIDFTIDASINQVHLVLDDFVVSWVDFIG